mgnify:CR=1 FL=1
MNIKTILITGASKGLGASFAFTLANEGYKIIGIARNETQLNSIINNLPNNHLNHEAISFDISDETFITKYLKDLNIYCLINNAGIASSKLLQDSTSEDIDQIIRLNLVSALNISNAVIPKMIENNVGRIINISSVLGIRPLKLVGAYSISKSALIQMTKSQSIELAKYNILVNALAPGYIITDLNREFLESDKVTPLVNKIPLKRVAKIEELSPVIKMLVDPNNTYMTGSIINVDGGMSASL